MPERATPSYELYGELLSGETTDPVHLEAIRERSIRHAWRIRLHRHRNLAQVFLFRTPEVSFRLGDVAHTTTEPLILFVPPGLAHGFRFNEDVDGDVLSLRVDGLGQGGATLLRQPAMGSVGILPRRRSENFDRIAVGFDLLGQAYRGVMAERSDVLGALAQLILTYVSGDMRRGATLGAVGPSERLSRHETLAEAFCAMVETHFGADVAVGGYARELGVSAPHLTRVCRSVLGATPNALVRQRRLLEAKRLLEYTRLSVSEVAHRAGFRDPSFFSRSFRSAFGASPKAWREMRGA